MPRTRRSRTIPVSADEVWSVIGDPYHLPRWWPRVDRIESSDHSGFTQVMTTERGRTVRADYRLTALEEEREIAWEQEVEGTPFERVLDRAATRITIEPQGDVETTVRIEIDQRMRGMSRLGGPMVRRASRELIDEALDGLVALYD